MDKVRKKFDAWAENGKAELMEREHGGNVLKFLNKISFNKSFSFLDVGCGNGWVVRYISNISTCKKTIGIDKSKKMITQATKKIKNNKESFFHTDVESWEYRGRFDFIFAMESIYYADSMEKAIKKIYKLLKPGGQFFCGTDFYTDNKATAKWEDMMKIQMHLHSKKNGKSFLKMQVSKQKTKQIRDLKGNKKWKRELGTLFIIGTKPTE
jgi:Methylase involved in ubiquinone/menaquinone biosynthesis